MLLQAFLLCEKNLNVPGAEYNHLENIRFFLFIENYQSRKKKRTVPDISSAPFDQPPFPKGYMRKHNK